MMLVADQRKWPQIAAAFHYMLDSGKKYFGELRDIAEFGVYKGRSLQKIINVLEANGIPHGNVYGFDSFQGLPKEARHVSLFTKFNEGSYKGFSIEVLREMFPYHNIYFIKKLYRSLGVLDVVNHTIQKFLFCHLDSDLYVSTYDALTFLFQNKLVDEGSLIAYDEFQSCTPMFSGGAALAHMMISDEFKVEFEEVWHTTYKDKQTEQPIRQNVFAINSIGKTSEVGINVSTNFV